MIRSDTLIIAVEVKLYHYLHFKLTFKCITHICTCYQSYLHFKLTCYHSYLHFKLTCYQSWYVVSGPEWKGDQPSPRQVGAVPRGGSKRGHRDGGQALGEVWERYGRRGKLGSYLTVHHEIRVGQSKSVSGLFHTQTKSSVFQLNTVSFLHNCSISYILKLAQQHLQHYT